MTTIQEKARELVMVLPVWSFDSSNAKLKLVNREDVLSLLTQIQDEARITGMIAQLKAVSGYLPEQEYKDRLADLEREQAAGGSAAGSKK